MGDKRGKVVGKLTIDQIHFVRQKLKRYNGACKCLTGCCMAWYRSLERLTWCECLTCAWCCMCCVSCIGEIADEIEEIADEVELEIKEEVSPTMNGHGRSNSGTSDSENIENSDDDSRSNTRSDIR